MMIKSWPGMNTVTFYIIYSIQSSLVTSHGGLSTWKNCGGTYKQKKHSTENSFHPKVE